METIASFLGTLGSKLLNFRYFSSSWTFVLESHLYPFLNCGGLSGCCSHLLSLGTHIWMQTRSERGSLHFSCPVWKLLTSPTTFYCKFKYKKFSKQWRWNLFKYRIRGSEAVSPKLKYPCFLSHVGKDTGTSVRSFVFSLASLWSTANVLVI